LQKITINHIRRLKGAERPFATLTAYDFTSAKIVDATGIPLILVGDSAAMVMLGYDTTLPVSMDEMVMLTSAVCRGVKHALVIADMPFMSYQASVSDALHSAGRFMKEAGAAGVKLEGGCRMNPQMRALVENGIPVMGHIGLTPQSVHQFSGYTVQGKTVDAIHNLMDDALAVADAGAFSLVLEGIPAEVAKMITQQIAIPTIGIGAGPHCDGQIQVFHDILGLYTEFIPKHTRQFGQTAEHMTRSIQAYIELVEARGFPSEENSTRLSALVLDALTAK